MKNLFILVIIPIVLLSCSQDKKYNLRLEGNWSYCQNGTHCEIYFHDSTLIWRISAYPEGLISSYSKKGNKIFIELNNSEATILEINQTSLSLMYFKDNGVNDTLSLTKTPINLSYNDLLNLVNSSEIESDFVSRLQSSNCSSQ